MDRTIGIAEALQNYDEALRLEIDPHDILNNLGLIHTRNGIKQLNIGKKQFA
jgi:hypothetical protein